LCDINHIFLIKTQRENLLGIQNDDSVLSIKPQASIYDHWSESPWLVVDGWRFPTAIATLQDRHPCTTMHDGGYPFPVPYFR